MKQFCKKAKQGNGHDVLPFIVYDCSIKDLRERLEQAKYLNSAKEVQAYIGLPRTQVTKFTSQEAVILQKRYFSKKLNREFAIRIDTNKIKSGSN